MCRLHTPPPCSATGCAWGRVRRGLDRRDRLRSPAQRLELRIKAIKDWA